MRLQQVGHALCLLGQYGQGVQKLLEAATLAEANPDQQLVCYGQAVWHLAELEPERARRLIEQGEALLARAHPERAGRFLNNAFMVHFQSGAWAEAEAAPHRALEFFPPDSIYRHIAVSNLAVVSWHRTGDLERVLSGRAAALAENRQHSPGNVPGDYLQLGELRLLLGQPEAALEHLREARRWAKANPRWSLQAEALRLYLEEETTAFPALLDRAKAWQDASFEDRVRALWAGALREQGKVAQARSCLTEQPGFFTALERALLQLEIGARSGALAALPPRPTPTAQREPRLYYAATRYRITRELEDLTALLDLTLVRERILPGLVPLTELPRDRPDLAGFYPLEAVLGSGWKEAVASRLGEIPALELTTFGGVRAQLLGEPLELPPKLKALLVMLVLRQPRYVIAEVLWPEVRADKAKNNLYVQLNLLRKLLEPWGVPTYLDETGLLRTETDLWQLEGAFAAGDAETVLRLYRGSFAPELDLPPIDEVRRGLSEKVTEVLYNAACKGSPIAEDCLKRVLKLEPLHEPALQELLKRLLKRGRRVEALRRYREFAEKLKEETGLKPLPETQEIVRLT